MRRRLAILITFCLLSGLVGGTAFWLRAQRRQYALNRALIATLVKGDDGRALALVNAGADPNTRYKFTPVPSLPEFVKQMLHRSPPPINDSVTALSIACGARDDEYVDYDAQQHRPDDAPLVQAMLLHNATVNVKDEAGMSPLMWVAAFNRIKTARLLLEHGASINAQNESGDTPLIYAAAPPAYPDMVRLLLEYGANIHAQDSNGRTALYWAVWYRENTDIIRQLLMHGANPNLADKNGVTPLMIVQQQQHPEIVALLKQYGARESGKRP